MQKAQGALEYLLLIGGAVLVAVIVITLILSIAGTGETQVTTTATTAFDKIREAAGGGSNNLLANGSFESGLSSWLTGGGISVSSSTDDRRTGNSSLKMTHDGSGSSYGYASQTLNVTAGDTYALSGWTKPNIIGGSARIAFSNSCTEGYRSLDWMTSSFPNVWTDGSGPVTCTAAGATITVEIKWDNLGSTIPNGTVYFDDIKLVKT
ncbi:MAG: carbohydrate binding domain-containing protein [Candidatus Diapherotrites archaeon]